MEVLPHRRSREPFMVVEAGEGQVHGQWVKKSEGPDCVPQELRGCTNLGLGRGGWVGGEITETSGRLRFRGDKHSLWATIGTGQEKEEWGYGMLMSRGCKAALSASPEPVNLPCPYMWGVGKMPKGSSSQEGSLQQGLKGPYSQGLNLDS